MVRRSLDKRYGSVLNAPFLPIRARGEGRWETSARGLKSLLVFLSSHPVLSTPTVQGFVAQVEKFSLGCKWGSVALHPVDPIRSHFTEVLLNEPR